MSHVCKWCIKHAYDLTNGQLNYDECQEAMGNDEMWAMFDEEHDCLAKVVDHDTEVPWAISCNCWCN